MGIKTAPQLLERDVKLESSKLSRQAAKLSKAKSGGAGIGGLLGAIAGVALAPFTGGASLLMAGIGGGLGALAGSKIAGSAAGGQESLMGGQFMQGSRHDIADQIAQQEGMDVLMAAGTGMLQAGNIAKGIKVFKGGMAAADVAGKGFLGQIGQGGFDVAKGMTKDLFKDFADPKKEKVAGLTKEALSEGATANIMDVMKITNPVGGVKKGGIGNVLGGIGDAASNIYGGADKLLGGALPFGQPLEEGYLGEGISGLLGSQTGQEDYSNQAMDLTGVTSQAMSGGEGTIQDILGQQANIDPNMADRIKRYMDSGWAPDDTIDMNAWKQMGGQ